MSNEEFLRRLKSALEHQLPPEELEDVMNYHREYFAEAGENAAAELDTPEVVAQRVLEEHLSEQPPKENTGKRRGLLCAAFFAALAVGLLVTILSWAGGRWVFDRVFRGEPSAQPITQVEAVDSFVVAELPTESAVIAPGTGETVEDEMEAFRRIDVQVPAADVYIVTGGDSYGLQWTCPQGQQLRQEVKNGALYLTGTLDKNVLNVQKATITIHIPTGEELTEVDVEVDLGDVELGALTAEKLDVHTNLGKITATDCAATDEVELSTDLGTVEVSGSFPCNVELESDLGDVQACLTGDLDKYGLELSTDLGNVYLNGEKVGDSYAVRGGPWAFTAKSDLGDVAVEFEG